jgi:DNA mismatch repair protein MutL
MTYQTLKLALSQSNMIPDLAINEPDKEVKKVFQSIPEPFEKNRLAPKNLVQNTTEGFTELAKLHEVISHAKEVSIYNTNSREDKNQQEMTNIKKEAKPEVGGQLTEMKQETFLTKEDKQKNFVIVGQLFSTYWMVECDQQLYIIDQHAAHEKILYEKTMKRLEEKQGEAQMISPPMIITLSLKEEEAIREHQELLRCLGFEIEPFGGKEYAVSGIPADMYGLCGQDLFLDFIDDMVQDVPKGTPDVILEKIASMSCKAAVKGNHQLSAMEAKALIEQLLSLENPFHCPHGRPIIVSMTKYELEKKFKRIL